MIQEDQTQVEQAYILHNSINVVQVFEGDKLGGSVKIISITILIRQSSVPSLRCAPPILDIKKENAFTQLKVGKITSLYGNGGFSGENWVTK